MTHLAKRDLETLRRMHDAGALVCPVPLPAAAQRLLDLGLIEVRRRRVRMRGRPQVRARLTADGYNVIAQPEPKLRGDDA